MPQYPKPSIHLRTSTNDYQQFIINGLVFSLCAVKTHPQLEYLFLWGHLISVVSAISTGSTLSFFTLTFTVFLLESATTINPIIGVVKIVITKVSQKPICLSISIVPTKVRSAYLHSIIKTKSFNIETWVDKSLFCK